MTKKIMAIVLATMMMLSCAVMVAGCGGKQVDNTITVTYLYGETVPKDLDKVEKALNEYIKDTGVQVELYPMGIMSVSQYSTILQGGDIDVLCIPFVSPYDLKDLNAIDVITEAELNEFAPDIVEMNKEYGMYVKDPSGNIISIATREEAVASGSTLNIRKSDLVACGLADKYPNQAKIDLDDLREILGALKEKVCKEGEYPLGITGDSCFNIMRDPCGVLDAAKPTGIINLTDDINSTTVVNPYETPQYLEYIAFMRECQEKGWVSPGADTAQELPVTSFETGAVRAITADCQESLRIGYISSTGEDCVQLHFVDPYYIFDNSQLSWGICSLTDNKEACLKFINAMMGDPNVPNMLQWGIEGEHYEFVDKENGLIDYVDGLDYSTTPFRNGLGVYGDKRYIYSYVVPGQDNETVIKVRQDDIIRANEAYANRRSKANGFVYDASKMSIKIANCANVCQEYAKILGVGKGDEAFYNQFISELKKAGIDDIIADKQAQLDAWLSQRG